MKNNGTFYKEKKVKRMKIVYCFFEDLMVQLKRFVISGYWKLRKSPTAEDRRKGRTKA